MTKTLRYSLYLISAVIVGTCLFTTEAFAKGSGGHSLGFGLSLVTASQKDLNNVMDETAENYPGDFGTKNLGSGYEFFAQYQYRFGGSMFAMIFRPSYFTTSSKGSCGGGSCDYSLSGFALFPILRIVPLENNFLKFFMQAGVGLGSLSGSVSEVSAKASFSGTAYGGLAGIGADFCFTANHCMTIEGNVRYLPVERNIADSVSGTFSSNGFSQIATNNEVEYNGSDLSTTMSGIQGVLAYTLNF